MIPPRCYFAALLRGVIRLAPSRVDGRAEHVHRLPASVHPNKQSNAVGQVFKPVVKGEAPEASAEAHLQQIAKRAHRSVQMPFGQAPWCVFAYSARAVNLLSAVVVHGGKAGRIRRRFPGSEHRCSPGQLAAVVYRLVRRDSSLAFQACKAELLGPR